MVFNILGKYGDIYIVVKDWHILGNYKAYVECVRAISKKEKFGTLNTKNTMNTPELVKEYLQQIKSIDKNKFVYVDETGLDIYFNRKYSKVPIGRKIERVSIVAA